MPENVRTNHDVMSDIQAATDADETCEGCDRAVDYHYQERHPEFDVPMCAECWAAENLGDWPGAR